MNFICYHFAYFIFPHPQAFFESEGKELVLLNKGSLGKRRPGFWSSKKSRNKLPFISFHFQIFLNLGQTVTENCPAKLLQRDLFLIKRSSPDFQSQSTQEIQDRLCMVFYV